MYKQILEELNLKVGDIVEITHKVPGKNLGWMNGWVDSMDEFIGKQVTVEDIRENGEGVRIKESLFSFPPQSLKVVSRVGEIKHVRISDEFVATIYPGKRIVVGCQTIDKETFEKVKKAFEGAK